MKGTVKQAAGTVEQAAMAYYYMMATRQERTGGGGNLKDEGFCSDTGILCGFSEAYTPPDQIEESKMTTRKRKSFKKMEDVLDGESIF